MTNDPWSPWKTNNVLPPPMRRVEMIRQQVAVHDLLTTTLPRHIRQDLRQFEERLASELANDNGRDSNGREGKASSAAES